MAVCLYAVSYTHLDVYKRQGLKLESETLVEYNPDFESEVCLPEKEQKILDMLSADPEQCVTKLEKETGIKTVSYTHLAGIAAIEEKLAEISGRIQTLEQFKTTTEATLEKLAAADVALQSSITRCV